MNDIRYLIFHKDHPLHVRGVNAGAEMATLRLAEFLARAGYQVRVCAQLADGTREHKGVEYYDLGGSYDVTRALEQARAFGPYHLISCGRALPILQSRGEECCRARILISQDRTSNDTGINAKILGRVADQVICVSNAQREFFVEDGIPAHKVSVLRNGADLEIFRAAEPDSRNYHRLVFAGALVQDKGIHLLIESFARLKRKYPDLELDVYGSSGMWGREKMFDEKEIEAGLPGIRFHGAVAQEVVAQAYQGAGIAVVPSIWFDPFPLTAMEAQVTGCPVVTFDVGGLGEGVLNGETGTVLPTVSQEALTAELDRLLSSPDELRRMSAMALKVQRPKYTWENFAAGVAEICQARSSMSADSGNTSSQPVGKQFGFMTSWNQECGLATYARYLLSEMPVNSFVVLAEKVDDSALLEEDEKYVERCWKRGASDWIDLKEALKRNDIGLLHINAQPAFFADASFSELLREVRSQGTKIVIHFHNIYTLDSRVQALVAVADRVIVHSPENRLETIANGAQTEQVVVLPHGVEVKELLSEAERQALRLELGMKPEERAIATFGFVQAHKGTDTLLRIVAELNDAGMACRGYVCGKPNESDPSAKEYMRSLRQLTRDLRIEDKIVFLDSFLHEDEVTRYLVAADVVLMDYRSEYFESSGAGALAIGAGAVVATSTAPPMMTFGDAVWHITQGFPAPLSVALLLGNQALYEEVRKNARAYAKRNSWQETSRRLLKIYHDLDFQPTASAVQIESAVEKEKTVTTHIPQNQRAKEGHSIRVLVQNRHNTFSQRGGDSIVIEKTVAGLERRGVDVTIDLQGTENPADYDIVHLINFALPEFTRILAERAYNAGTPYVVTTLYEDVPMFHNQSILVANVLKEYVSKGQDRAWWIQNHFELSQVEPCARFNNDWTAAHAAMLITNGSRESATIRRDYGADVPITEVKLGYEIGAVEDAGLFEREYGVKDFVFSVGRFESRKNQLMLLKALEDSAIPVVLASGGFSYQAEYDRAVRTFKRRGQTIILERVSSEMLASAYAAARVHALPSWYELPGLVSLEAAYNGCNVVVTDNGTARDYFGDEAFYCSPGDEQSICQAVMEAYASDVPSTLRQRVMAHTWDSVAEQTLAIYERALGISNVDQVSTTGTAASIESFQAAAEVEPEADQQGTTAEEFESGFDSLLEKGEAAAQEKNYARAQELLSKALTLNPTSVRALKARGAVHLAEKQLEEAKYFFETAHRLDPTDARTLSGLGMCCMMDNDVHTAYPYFVEALKHEATQMVAILQLIEASYMIGRYDDLERVLSEYVQQDPDDDNMQYCLAGCLYRQEKFVEAEDVCKRVLLVNPGHIGSKELLKKIEEERGSAPIRVTPIAAQSLQAANAPVTVTTIDLSPPPEPEPNGWKKLAQQAIASVKASRAGVSAEESPQKVSLTVKPSSSSAKVMPAYSEPAELESTSSVEVEVVSGAPAEASVSVSSQIARADEAKRRRQLDECLEGCESVLLDSSASVEQKRTAMLLKAEALVLKGKAQEACSIFESVLLEDSGNPRALCGQGAVLASQEDWESAATKFEEARKANPRYDVALAGLGMKAARDGDHEMAWQLYQEALSINPENSRALLGVIEIGYGTKRYSQVETALKRYLDMHPVDLNFLYSLAGCYYAQGKLEEALSELQKITLFQPHHEQACELKTMIDERLGSSL